MALRWMGGDMIRRMMAIREFQSAGLGTKAAEAMVDAGILSLRELIEAPWTDEEAGRRFVSLRWRLSMSPLSSAKILAQADAFRARLIEERKAA